jgi:hypothetical protein
MLNKKVAHANNRSNGVLREYFTFHKRIEDRHALTPKVAGPCRAFKDITKGEGCILACFIMREYSVISTQMECCIARS